MDFRDLAQGALSVLMESLGQPVTYRPASGGSISLRGVFNSAHRLVDLGESAPVSSLSSSLGIQLSDLPVPPSQGDQATLDDMTYGVVDIQLDGQGGALLILGKP